MIKRVRLDYKPVAKRTSEEAAFVVSAEHVAAVNRSCLLYTSDAADE